jgi:hypothetical protein
LKWIQELKFLAPNKIAKKGLFCTREVLVASSFLEILYVLAICSGVSMRTKLVLTLWLSGLYAVYRARLWFIGTAGLCPCFGSLGDVVHLRQSTVQLCGQLLLMYLIGFSSVFLVRRAWREGVE